MTRPPLYVRRPFLAGLLRQLPLLAVLLVVGTGLFVVSIGHWRQGLVMAGLALVGGALLRLLLPERRSGFLAVRSRPVDFVLMAGAGLALTVIAVMIPAA
jgi:membrane protease YdiL (CAAX protease family)